MLSQLRWIYLAQAANFATPLLFMPVVAHRLGPLGFASFTVVTGIAQYATLGVELGLNHSGLAQLKRASTESERRRIFSEIFYLKVILTCLVCAAATIVVSHTTVSREVSNWQFATLFSGPLIACIVCPVWFFVLSNRLDVNFMIVLGSRALALTACLLFVHAPVDFFKAAAFYNFATLPFAAYFARHWLSLVLSPHRLDWRAVFSRLQIGLQMSSVMLRETITNIGIAPIYGLWIFDSSLGVYAFAEKVSKIFILPAPILTSSLIAASSHAQDRFRLPGVLSKIGLGGLLFGLALLYLVSAIGLKYALALVFPAFMGSYPIICVLACVFPIVYFNYFEIGMKYTKHGQFRAAGGLSSLYLCMLFTACTLLSYFYGIFGLAMGSSFTEIAFMLFLLRMRFNALGK